MLESVLSADLITEILTAGKVARPKEFTGMHWPAVPDLFACSDNQEFMWGRVSVCQSKTGVIAHGVVYDGSNSQVALGGANVHAVDL